MSTAGISLLSQSNAQSRRLTALGVQLDNLERQVTTGKLYDSYAGFGSKSYKVQTLRIDTNSVQTYRDNASKTSDDLENMSSIMEELSGICTEIEGAMVLTEFSADDIERLSETASQYLDYIEDLLNTVGTDGTYLFSGVNTDQKTFISNDALNNNTNNAITNWLNGTITSDQMINNISSLDTANLGLNPTLDSAANRRVTIDDGTTIEYSITGNLDGIEGLLTSLSTLANLKFPDAGDVGTTDDLEQILKAVSNMVNESASSINSATVKLSSNYTMVESVSSRLTTEYTLLKDQSDDLENVDTTQALLNMQLLETQIEAAYQITSMVSQLSLVNYL